MKPVVIVVAFFLLLTSAAAGAAPCAGFVDVEDTDPFCPNVTWMKQNSITLGCTATQYCPSDFVTRLQMAAFMNRLGNVVGDITGVAAGVGLTGGGLSGEVTLGIANGGVTPPRSRTARSRSPSSPPWAAAAARSSSSTAPAGHAPPTRPEAVAPSPRSAPGPA